MIAAALEHPVSQVLIAFFLTFAALLMLSATAFAYMGAAVVLIPMLVVIALLGPGIVGGLFTRLPVVLGAGFGSLAFLGAYIHGGL